MELLGPGAAVFSLCGKVAIVDQGKAYGVSDYLGYKGGRDWSGRQVRKLPPEDFSSPQATATGYRVVRHPLVRQQPMG